MKHYRVWRNHDVDTPLKWTLRDYYEGFYRRASQPDHAGCSGEHCLRYDCFMRRQVNQVLARHLVCGPGTRWLEVGCGEAATSRYFANRGAQVCLVDPAEAAIRLARSTFEMDHLHPFVMRGDGFALAFRDASFDVVGCIGVLENLPDSERLLSEMARVVEPGGLCFALIQVYTRVTAQSVLIPLVFLRGLVKRGFDAARDNVRNYRECPHPVNPATLEEYQAKFRAAGFRTVSVWNVNFFPALPIRGTLERLYVLAIRSILRVRGRLGVREPFATRSGFGKTWVVIAKK